MLTGSSPRRRGRYEEERAMTEQMGRVICDITISADGYSAGLNETEERPFGDDGGDGSGGKRPDGRVAAAHCPADALRRHAPVRGRPAGETRAGKVTGRDLGYARDLPRAVLSRRATGPSPVAEYAETRRSRKPADVIGRNPA